MRKWRGQGWYAGFRYEEKDYGLELLPYCDAKSLLVQDAMHKLVAVAQAEGPILFSHIIPKGGLVNLLKNSSGFLLKDE